MFSAMGAVLAVMLLGVIMMALRVSHRFAGPGPRFKAVAEKASQFPRLRTKDFQVRRTDFDRWLYDAVSEALRARDLRTTAYLNVMKGIAEPLLEVAQAASETDRREVQALADLLMNEDRLVAGLMEDLDRARRERGWAPNA
jgi:hypothetical protein